MVELIEEIEKEIDKLYKVYYNTHYRDRAEQIKLLNKIAALKYQIKNIKKELFDGLD